MANNEQINALINQLSEKLNTDSKQVKDALQKGNFQQVLKNMDENQAQKDKSLMRISKNSKQKYCTASVSLNLFETKVVVMTIQIQ